MRTKMVFIVSAFMLSTILSASALANDANKLPITPSDTSNKTHTTHDAIKAIKAAKAAKTAQLEAASLGFEWRDTAAIIKEAEMASNEGKNKQAIELANIVANQIAAIRKQAAIAKNAGPRF